MKLFFLLLLTLTLSCTNTIPEKNNSDTSSLSKNEQASDHYKVLFVTSNAKYYGNSTIETTNNFPEIVYAYHEFMNTNIEVDFVSPNGGQVPIGYIHSSDEVIQNYLFDETLLRKLKNTLKPSDVVKDQYRAIYYVGGGSAMFGIPENKPIQEIATYIIEQNDGILTGICHGIAGMVNIKNNNGTYALLNKKVTGFPNAFEDTTATYYKQFPFSIDQAVTDRGATFEYSKKGWDGFYISEDKLITGQDPSSAHSIAKEIIKKLTKSK